MSAVMIKHAPFCRFVTVDDLSVCFIGVVICVISHITAVCTKTGIQSAVIRHHIDCHRDRLSIHYDPITQKRCHRLRSYVIQNSELTLLVAEAWVLIE